jgi:hypothetical protein
MSATSPKRRDSLATAAAAGAVSFLPGNFLWWITVNHISGFDIYVPYE